MGTISQQPSLADGSTPAVLPPKARDSVPEVMHKEHAATSIPTTGDYEANGRARSPTHSTVRLRAQSQTGI